MVLIASETLAFFIAGVGIGAAEDRVKKNRVSVTNFLI